MGPSCLVKAKVIATSKNKVSIQVLESSCDFIKSNSIHDFSKDFHPLVLHDSLEIGIERASSMGPKGLVEYNQWSPVKKSGKLIEGLYFQN
jgi:hypothetical protein